MKITFILVLTFATAIVTAQNIELNKNDVKIHCNNFITVLKSGDLESSLIFFYPYYVEDQHNKMLAGNTSQFVTEFLAGSTNSKSGEEVYIVPKMSDIVSIKVKKTKLNANKATGFAEVEIRLNTGTKYKTTLNLVIGNDNKLYFIGPMG